MMFSPTVPGLFIQVSFPRNWTDQFVKIAKFLMPIDFFSALVIIKMTFNNNFSENYFSFETLRI